MTTTHSIQDSLRPSIRAMDGYVPGEQPQGISKFIKLNTNENPYPPSPRVGPAIEAVIDSLWRYPDPVANGFRLSAAEQFNVDQDQVLCGNGSDDLLTILTRAFVPEGGAIAFPRPSYTLYRTLAEIQGARVHELPFDDQWSISPDEVPSDTNLLFLPNPNSPTGTTLAPSQIRDLAANIRCPIVVDEAYADFAESNCLPLVDEFENVIVTRTLSKSYGLAGVRFGYLVAQRHVVAELSKVKDSYNCDALSIAAATAAINDREWFLENRQKIIEGRERLADRLSRLGFSLEPSQANFVWCRHPNVSSQQIYEQLKASQILVRYMNYKDWGDGLRISVGTSSQIEALCTVLESILAESS